MMDIIESYSIYALLVANALLSGAAALAVVRFQRRFSRSSKFWESITGSTLLAQRVPAGTDLQTEQRLAALQEAVDRFARMDNAVEPVKEKLPFENAVRMAKAGASVDDLVRTCGLSHGEARLFMRVHARSAA